MTTLGNAATATIVGLGLIVGLCASVVTGLFVYQQWGLGWLLVSVTILPVVEAVGSCAYLLVTVPLIALARRSEP